MLVIAAVLIVFLSIIFMFELESMCKVVLLVGFMSMGSCFVEE
jgi:hypothetical protein